MRGEYKMNEKCREYNVEGNVVYHRSLKDEEFCTGDIEFDSKYGLIESILSEGRFAKSLYGCEVKGMNGLKDMNKLVVQCHGSKHLYYFDLEIFWSFMGSVPYEDIDSLTHYVHTSVHGGTSYFVYRGDTLLFCQKQLIGGKE